MSEKSRAGRVEIFSQAIVSGKSQSDAYRAAYPNSKKWVDRTIHSRASEMAKESEVTARVSELRQEIAKKQIWTREESIEGFRGIFYASDADIKYSDRNAAGKVLNDMCGYTGPMKIDHSSSDGSMSPKPLLDVKKLSDSAMKEILEAYDDEENVG